MWVNLFNEVISLLFLVTFGIILYRGFKRNQNLLTEREELLRRYLIFRGDKQVRLKVYGEDEKIYRELIKNLSNSWKNFKKTYDQYLLSLAKNTGRTKLFLQVLTLGLLINSARLFLGETFLSDSRVHLFYTVARELSTYVLVILSFALLRIQTHRLLSLKGEATKLDREVLFYPNNLSPEGEHEALYDEFDPLRATGGEDGEEDQDTGG
jgi:hypothetical protein